MAVLGGGISGLAAAHRLLERGKELDRTPAIAVFEARSRAGGIVSTVESQGFLIEEGPDAFITDKPWAYALAERLGLGEHIIATRPEFRRSYIVRAGRLVPTPDGLQLLAPSRLGPMFRSPLLSPLGKLRLSLEPWLSPRRAGGDESLGSFVTRRLGREMLERVAEPMVAGIYGADPMRLSLAATFPRFLAMERDSGSVIRGLRAAAAAAATGAGGAGGAPASGPRYGLFASFEGGMGELVTALLAHLPAGTLRLGTAVEALAPQPGVWSLRPAGGQAQIFDSVILALPGPAAAGLVADFAPELARGLRSIE